MGSHFHYILSLSIVISIILFQIYVSHNIININVSSLSNSTSSNTTSSNISYNISIIANISIHMVFIYLFISNYNNPRRVTYYTSNMSTYNNISLINNINNITYLYYLMLYNNTLSSNTNNLINN